jgi:hypothetical protein
MGMLSIEPFPKIANAKNFFRNARRHGHDLMDMRSKLKLHGANVAITIQPDQPPKFHSRRRDISPADDFCGFATWASSRLGTRRSAVSSWTIFGEWVGPGVQRAPDVAVSHLESKRFAVFAVRRSSGETYKWYVEPVSIAEFLRTVASNTLSEAVVLPWLGEPQRVAMVPGAFHTFCHEMQEVAEEVATTCPFAKGLGVDGMGEGIVVYASPYGSRWTPERAFKMKGSAYTGAYSLGPLAEKASKDYDAITALAHDVVTQERISQAWSEIVDPAAERHPLSWMPDLMRWIGDDVVAEHVAEFEETGTTWRDVSRVAGAVVRLWVQRTQIK